MAVKVRLTGHEGELWTKIHKLKQVVRITKQPRFWADNDKGYTTSAPGYGRIGRMYLEIE